MENWATRAALGTALGTALVIGFGVKTCSYSGSPAKAAVKLEKDRKVAPGFTLKDSNGKQAKLSDYRGKVVLLNFWATWCGPCKIEIPWFMEFEQNYKDKGFSVVGVSMDEDGWDAVKPYLDNRKVNYRVVMGDDTVGNLYGGIESLPTTFLIDRDGRVASVHIGLVSKRDYETEIAHLVDAKAATAAGAVRGGPLQAVAR